MKNSLSAIFLGIIIGILSIVLFTDCKRLKKTDAEYERENWISGFSDSIQYYTDKITIIDNQLEQANKIVAQELENFEMIKNPREVSGYYILKTWSKKLPMTTTSLIARINENEKLELIATLAGSTFNEIRVLTGNETVGAEVMPHDQAFNFRHQRYNTVYFFGGKADTIANVIADHATDKITVDFMEGKVKKQLQLPSDQKSMIEQTWALYSAQSEVRSLQKELYVCSHKIEAFRRIMDAEAKKSE